MHVLFRDLTMFYVFFSFQTEDQVDMQRKMMEDPLMAIRQREMDSRKKLLENPVKLKEIHRLLEADKKLKTSHKSKKKSKKSKKKRSRSSSSSSSSNDSDLDAALAKKYKTVLKDEDKMADKLSADKFFNEKYEKLSKELDKMRKSKKTSKKSKSKKKNRDSSDSDSSSDEKTTRTKRRDSKERDNRGNRNGDEKRRRSVDRHKISPSRERDSSRRHRSRTPQKLGSRRDDGRHTDQNKQSGRDRRVDRDNRSDRDRHSDRERRSERDRHSESDGRSDKYRHQERDRRSDRDRHPNKDKHTERKRSRSRSRSNSRSRKQKSIDRPKSTREKQSRTPDARPIRTAELPPKRASTSGSSDSSSDSSDNEKVQKPTRNFGLVTASGDRIELKNKEPIKRASPVRREPEKKNPFSRPASSAPKTKMTEEDRQARIREMQSNAQWHENEQSISRRRHEKVLQQDKAIEQTLEFDKSYIHKEMNKALNNQGSVEARIKSNVNNIQRLSSSMQSHFTRK